MLRAFLGRVPFLSTCCRARYNQGLPSLPKACGREPLRELKIAAEVKVQVRCQGVVLDEPVLNPVDALVL